RAPCTATVVRAAARGAAWLLPFEDGAAGAAFFRLRFTAVLEAIPRLPHVEEREFLHLDVPPLPEADGRPGLADESLVRQVLARRGHAAHVEVSLEVAFDLAARPRLAGLAQVIDHRPKERRRATRHVGIDRVQRRLYGLPRLPGVQQVGVNRLEK